MTHKFDNKGIKGQTSRLRHPGSLCSDKKVANKNSNDRAGEMPES